MTYPHRNSILINRLFFFLLTVLFVLKGPSGFSQTDSVADSKRVIVFAPLYLDSAFDAAGNYKHGKTLPRYFNAGLEFYQGIQMAIDSLQKEKITLDIHIFDTRSKDKIEALLQKEEVKSASLFIGHVNINEAAQLARAAAGMEIPFININLPNDAGVKGNKEYIVLNPTLSTHCQAIYKFLQKNHALSNIVYFRKKGTVDDRLKSFFAEAEKSTASVPLKIKYITLEDTIGVDQLKQFVDSSKNNVCVIGSLDMNFGLTIYRQLASLSKSYKSILIGMPTWEQADVSKPHFRGVELIYGSPLYINGDNRLVQQIQRLYKNKYFSRAGDMVFASFETLYHFAHLLQKPGAINDSFQGKANTIFGEIDIQPVVNKQTSTVDYYENKKIYFIKKADGQVKAVY